MEPEVERLNKFVEKCKEGEIQYLKKELNGYQPIDLNLKKDLQYVPLIEAAKVGNIEVVKLLISYGAQVNTYYSGFLDTYIQTPLTEAVKNGHIDVVKYLIEKKGSLTYNYESLKNVKSLMVKSPLHLAAENRDFNMVKLLVENGHPLYIPVKKGLFSSQPIELAAKKNSVEIVDYLFKKGFKYSDEPTINILHIGAENGNLDIIKLGIKYGVDINHPTKISLRPLHYAIKGKGSNKIELVKFLVKNGASLDVVDSKNITPLGKALNLDPFSIELIDTLIELGATFEKLDISEAFEKKKYGSIRYILTKFDSYGKKELDKSFGIGKKTALHLATINKQNEIAQILIDKNVDLNIKDFLERTPIFYAISNNNLELVKLLIKNGASIDLKDRVGYSCLHIAAKSDSKESIDIFLDKGLDINGKSYAGYTPLHVAAMFGDIKTVQYLVEHGADPNLRTNMGVVFKRSIWNIFGIIGDKPYHSAIGRNERKIAEYLKSVMN